MSQPPLYIHISSVIHLPRLAAMATTKTTLFMEFLDRESIIRTFLIPLLALFILRLLFNRSVRLPPGPPKLPLIGNMNQLMGPSPHRALGELAQKYGPLMHLKLGSVPTIIISSAEMAKEILKTKDHIFANRPKLVAPKILGYNYTDVAFAPYGPYWRQLRKICIYELLNPKRVRSCRYVREEEVGLFIRYIASTIPEQKPINLAERLFILNHDIVTRITFSKKFEDQKRFRDALKEGTALAAGFQIGDFFPSLAFVGVITGMKGRLEKNFVDLDSITNTIIEQHIERSKICKPENEDLVDVLLRLKDSGELEVPLTIDNIKSVILDIFTGATENAANSIEWAMSEMIKNPRIMEKAQEEVRQIVGGKATVEETDLEKLSYVKSIIKEILRFRPSVPLLIPRESMEKCTINGYDIPAKTRTIINYWAIGRDPESWKNPEIFDPERFEENSVDLKGQNFEFIPFGAGRRICPGISFATVNMELTLASMLYHFDWKLPNGMKPEDLSMDETFGLTMYRSSNLLLVPTVRFPVPS